MRGRRWRCGAVILAVVAAGCTATPTGPAAMPAGASTATPAGAPMATPAIPSGSPIGASDSAPAVSGASSSTSATPTPAAPTPAAADPDPTRVAQPAVSVPATSSARVAATSLPAVDLAGVNVAGCRSAHRPVVLLHGSFSTVGSNFAALVPALLAGGRCVYGVNYGNAGIAAVTSSAAQAASLVRAVLADTGAGTVDVVAYSQGGLVLRTALRFDGLADDVTTAVLIAPSWHGTTSRAAASAPASLCPACADQVAGSALLQRLSVGGELDGKVRYAEISTRRDIVVLPVAAQVPAGPPDRVRSVVLEDVCPQVVTDHVHLPAVPGVVAWTVTALDAAGRPPATALTC